MGFEDLFDNKKKYIKYNYYLGNHHRDHRYEDSYSYKMPGRGNYVLFILERIWNNRKLRFMLILTILSLLAILITALILIIPLIGGILDTVAKTGLKGVLEEITGLINGIWNGTGK